MKIRYMSDLHTEFEDDPPGFIPPIGEDLVVLAGDIGNGAAGVEWAKQAFAGRAVVFLAGNHSYYKRPFFQTLDEMRVAASGSNVHFLERDSVRIGELTVLGCTLWTNFRMCESTGITQQLAMNICAQRFNDYRVITNDRAGRLLRPEDVLQQHEESVRWLTGQIAQAESKVLVVTHHAPIIEYNNPRFNYDAMAAGYYSDLTELMDGTRIHAWIFGHTHHGGEYLGGRDAEPVKVVSNPRGYPGDDLGFDWDRCLEITPQPIESPIEDSPHSSP